MSYPLFVLPLIIVFLFVVAQQKHRQRAEYLASRLRRLQHEFQCVPFDLLDSPTGRRLLSIGTVVGRIEKKTQFFERESGILRLRFTRSWSVNRRIQDLEKRVAKLEAKRSLASTEV